MSPSSEVKPRRCSMMPVLNASDSTVASKLYAVAWWLKRIVPEGPMLMSVAMSSAPGSAGTSFGAAPTIKTPRRGTVKRGSGSSLPR
jgi:hypothetical protein